LSVLAFSYNKKKNENGIKRKCVTMNIEDKDTIAFLSNYITELKKEHLDEKGREILRVTEQILRKEIALRSELKELRAKTDNIKSMCRSKPQFYSHTPKDEYEKSSIEELSKNADLDKILNLSTELIIQRNKKR